MQQFIRIARMGFWLGATVFGGVNAAYPVIRARAGELGEITPDEVDGLYALSVFVPGPSFPNLWGAVTMRAAGWPAAVVGQVALLLPAFLLVLALPLAGAVPAIAARGDGAFNGAVWATVGLLISVGIDSVRKLKSTMHHLMAAGLLVALLMRLHPVLLLVAAIGIGAVQGIVAARKEAA